ncbi:MAG: hypothetical protein E7046_08325, partial [Lentisphaerae bacterium]|nr:hypothetical protein [Lentisphaerota bacterium]
MKTNKSIDGIACILAVAAIASASALAEDFTVPAGSPTTLTASQAATIYDNVNVNDDLTIDGTYCTGLTNSSSVIIGAKAAKPVTVTVKNGAKWVLPENNTITFTGKGGTLEVSQTEAPSYIYGSKANVPGVGDNIYPTAFGTMGYYSYVEVSANAEAPGGVMDIARLLPNGTVSFRRVKNVNPNVAARILFQGGAHWVQNKGGTRFNVLNNAKIILESVDGNPIDMRALASNYTLFEGAGTLETRGDGDFMMYHNAAAPNWTITLSHDDGGEIIWNHKGRTVFSGRGRWLMGNDNILPYGAHNGPVVLYNSTNPTDPTTIDLNGKTVTVNGLLKDGARADKNSITNSSETVATLRLNVDSDTNLNEVLTANFAPDAVSNIKLQKIGAGVLTLNSGSLPAVRSFDVAEGMLVAKNTSRGGNLVAKNGSALVLKHPYINKNAMDDGFCPDSFVVDASGGKAVLSNVWQRAMTVRSGTASIENGSINITPTEMPWRPAASVIGAVDVEGGILDVVRGRLVSTNISIASGASLRIRGGVGMTNKVEFYKSALSDRYYRFIFKESKNRQSFGLNQLYLRMGNGGRTFSVTSATAVPTYSLDKDAMSVSDLAEGEYMYSCPNGIVYTEGKRSNENCVYSPSGLSDRYSWGGVMINENRGLSLADPNTWVTLTIRLRADVSLPILGYHLTTDWFVDKLCAWEVQASSDGTTWRTVDERRNADIYMYSTAGTQYTDWDGYNMFNGEEGFQWRCLADDSLFDCDGTVQVDEGGVLDLRCVPDENISIKSLTVDAASGGGSIVKFRPAENGTLNLVGINGELPRRYTVPVALPDAVDVERFSTWRVMVNGEPS